MFFAFQFLPFSGARCRLLVSRIARGEYVQRTIRVKFFSRRTINCRHRDGARFPRQFDHARLGAGAVRQSCKAFTLSPFSLWLHWLAAQ
jgi:hypothetical protein